MPFDLPSNWVADHDQREAELRELVRPIVASMLAVRDSGDEVAMDEGLKLAATLAEHLGPLPSDRVLELLFLALTKIAGYALERYDARMEEFDAQRDRHASSQRDAGCDADSPDE